MDMERKSLRIGTAVVGCALLLRLLSGSLIGNTAQLLSQPPFASWILFFETGRLVRPAPVADPTDPTQAVPGPNEPAPEDALPVFSASDASLITLHNYSGYAVDIPALLQQPLAWELAGDEPTVLILHTHATESYTNTENYPESSGYRTLDTQYNMVSVGERLAQLLEEAHIPVVHDRSLHDDPSYSGAYTQSREAIQAYLKQYPTIRLVLDLHRDSVEDSSGQQVRYTLSTDQGTAAKLMLVMGTDAGGLTHPNWSENLALAVKLQAQLEKNNPGLCRPLSFRSSRFNQDLSSGALLVEMGSAGNTRQEALRSAELLAAAIIALAHGSTADSTS